VQKLQNSRYWWILLHGENFSRKSPQCTKHLGHTILTTGIAVLLINLLLRPQTSLKEAKIPKNSIKIIYLLSFSYPPYIFFIIGQNG
jgi:hypothetical protein